MQQKQIIKYQDNVIVNYVMEIKNVNKHNTTAYVPALCVPCFKN